MANEPESFLKDGKRLDGRALDEARPMEIEAGVIENADGSALVKFGKTHVLAAVHGPRELHPRHLVVSDKALVRARYDMLPFSVEDRKRPGPGRREREISKVLSEAFTRVVEVEQFPRTVVDIFVTVQQADASTRITGLNAASVALADAGIPMRSMVTGITFGKISDGKKGYMVLDVGKEEDAFGMADVAYARAYNLDETVLLQMDGNITKEDFFEGKKMADKAIEKVYEAQVAALKSRYKEGSE